MATSKQAESITIPQLDIRRYQITLVGDSQLVCHKWSEKAKRAMLDKQMKRATPKKEAKDPEADYLSSLYDHPAGGYGFPVVAFKSAAVDACSYVSGVTKVAARGAFHVIGDFARIEGEPRMREDLVRVGMGTADLRYRAEFLQWRTTLDIRLNPSILSPEQLINLFNHAGFSVGVGEYRPQKNGSWGMFHVALGGE